MTEKFDKILNREIENMALCFGGDWKESIKDDHPLCFGGDWLESIEEETEKQMKTVEYSIGLDWRDKSQSLYLYRQDGSCISTIARFYSPNQAEQFAKEWGYPLSDTVKEFIENYKKEQRK